MIIMVLFIALIPATGVRAQDYNQLFRQGVQLYRAGEYTGAAEQFEAAAVAARRKRKYTDALYNAGTSRTRIGEQKAEGDIRSAAEEYRKAILDYERVLQVDGKFEEAAHNLEVVRIRLNELEKTMDRDKQDRDKQDQDKQDQDKQDRDKEDRDKQDQDKGSKGREQSGSGQDNGADQDGTGQGQEEQDRQGNRNPGTLQEQQGETAAEGILKEEREERFRRVFESYTAAEHVEKDW